MYGRETMSFTAFWHLASKTVAARQCVVLPSQQGDVYDKMCEGGVWVEVSAVTVVSYNRLPKYLVIQSGRFGRG